MNLPVSHQRTCRADKYFLLESGTVFPNIIAFDAEA
jgi:hypothetical protein